MYRKCTSDFAASGDTSCRVTTPVCPSCRREHCTLVQHLPSIQPYQGGCPTHSEPLPINRFGEPFALRADDVLVYLGGVVATPDFKVAVGTAGKEPRCDEQAIQVMAWNDGLLFEDRDWGK